MRCLSILFCLFISCACFGQVRLENVNLINKSKKEIYAGWDNLLIPRDIDTSGKKIDLISKKCKVSKTKLGFLLKPKYSGIDTSSLFINAEKVLENVFEIIQKQSLSPFIISPTRKTASIKLLSANPILYFWPHFNNYRMNASIRSFRIQVENEKGNLLYSLNNRGRRITEGNLNIIQNLSKGCILRFENIIVTGTGSNFCNIKLPSFTITII